MRSIHHIVLAGLLSTFVAACANSSEKLAKEVQDANSWIASTQILAKSYADGAVPKAYTHDALESFNQQLQSTAKRVQSISDPRASQVVASLQRAQKVIGQMDGSIEQNDQLSLAQFALQLENEQKRLITLVNPAAGAARQP